MFRAALAPAAAAALFAVVCMAAMRKPMRRLDPRVAPEPPAPPPAPAPAEELGAAIARTNEQSREALARADAQAFAGRFADDSLSLPAAGAIVHGRAAIEAAMREVFHQAHFRDAEWRTLETHVDGAQGFEIGVYRFEVEIDATARAKTLSGRYFVVWKWIGTAWKIAVDVAQPDAEV